MASSMAMLTQVQPNNGNLQLTLFVVYVGEDIPGGGPDSAYVTVDVLGDATAVQVRTQMSAAVTADAVTRGYTAPGNRMTLPAFQKG